MTGIFIRILLRYAAGALVAKGLLSAEDGATFISDPDITQLLEAGAGLAIGAATELWYWAARKYGWAK
jgi:hypothetical protein